MLIQNEDSINRKKVHSIMDHINNQRENNDYLQRLERAENAISSLKLDMRELSLENKKFPKQSS